MAGKFGACRKYFASRVLPGGRLQLVTLVLDLAVSQNEGP